MTRPILAALALLLSAADARAQSVDSVVTWRTYSSERSARVRVFVADDEKRPHTVVVDERASNGGVVTDDVRFLADHLGRELGFDPVAATYVFRFTPASFVEGADDRGKTLLLRVTFSRGASGALVSPTWRAISADELDGLTDRAFR